MYRLLFVSFVVLGLLAFGLAVLLYVTAKKFAVTENPLKEKIKDLLPQANCGACGKAGCEDFAKACANADKESFSALYCPVGGAVTMGKIASLLGFETESHKKEFAVIHCQGTCEKAIKKVEYTGLKSCRLANMVATGERACPSGCLHFGDCVSVCKFGALTLDAEKGMPVVDIDKCVGCGACVNICPRKLIELKSFDENGNLLYVACKNTQKGAVALKNCKAACIACGKCAKICPQAEIKNNLSHITEDVDTKTYGEDLAKGCPTKAIVFMSDGTKGSMTDEK